MTKESSQLARIGATFLSGKQVPFSGIYEFARHFDIGPCFLTHAANRVMLAKGNTFPRHGICQRRVIWRLREVIGDGEANELL